jgi:hypothetical protein
MFDHGDLEQHPEQVVVFLFSNIFTEIEKSPEIFIQFE